MKVYLCYTSGCHPKNLESMRAMMTTNNIDYTESSNVSTLDRTYDLVLCLNEFYPPSAFPDNVKVVFGPHLFVFPDDPAHSLRTTTFPPHRFFYNTISEWNAAIHTQFAKLTIPYISVPFGVNTQALTPVPPPPERTKVMLYFKNRCSEDYELALRYLQSTHPNYTVIRYGSYKDSEFKEVLRSTKFVLWIGSHESQGFALQETLAMNVPVLLWDATSMHQEVQHGRFVHHSRVCELPCTTATTWSAECGLRFTKAEELPSAFQSMMDLWTEFHPRQVIESCVGLKPAFAALCAATGIVFPMR